MSLVAPADQPLATRTAQKPSVLVVEDDFLVATDVENALTDAGYEVVGVAVSASEAIQLAAQLSPTIAIMDVRLAGGRDGIDVALELFRNHNIRCVFASAHTDAETRARAADASPLGWLAKPYTPIALIEILRRVLPGSG